MKKVFLIALETNNGTLYYYEGQGKYGLATFIHSPDYAKEFASKKIALDFIEADRKKEATIFYDCLLRIDECIKIK